MSKRPLVLSRLVLDVLKPYIPDLIDFCKELSTIKGVKKISGVVVEVDVETDTVKITIEGKDVTFEEVEERVKAMGAAIHSIDEV
ncbi:MAG: DUF211 domain-containing protein, partial [Candidatus Bathyarchaeota archaeon]|nr:DUF211 domain-containing protein [Candidatus Bathyarchaeota archaeon]